MNTIYFPSINLRFEISKIAFSIFGIPVYKYAVCIVVGMIMGLIVCKINEKRFEIKYDFILESFIFTLVLGIIGARLYFVMFNLKYYSSLLKVLDIRDGGLAIYGGLISGAVFLVIHCKKRKIDVLNFFDYIVPAVAIGQAIGRWGNFFNVEAYGYQTKSIFRMGITTLEGYMEVPPTFLYESICTFIIFIILEIMQKNIKFKGQIFYMYCILYSATRFLIEGIREDSLMFCGFRISQVISVSIFIIGIFGILKNTKKRKTRL